MKKPNLRKQLTSMSSTLDRLAGYLEENNFPGQQILLDEAGERIDEVLEQLESL